MKKSIVSIIILLCFTIAKAQDFYGQATYMSKTTMDKSWMDNDRMRSMPADQRKRIEDRMKKMGEKTFVLRFNRNESIFKEEKELAAPGNGRGGWGNFMGTAMGGDKYKNLDDKQWIEQRDMMGKTFLVKDSIPQLDWKITGETKMIGQYQAIKATAVKMNNALDWSSFRRKRDEDKKKEEVKKSEKKDKDTASSTNLLDMIEQDETTQVTAWFTPQIPVQHGPAEYAGLPGLILEVSAGNTTLLCSKIEVNPEEREAIEPATKGTETTEQEYNALFTEKMQEMSKRFRGRGRGSRGRR
ncbi:MAG: GLPGLI family protein [Nonlabens sp.]